MFASAFAAAVKLRPLTLTLRRRNAQHFSESWAPFSAAEQKHKCPQRRLPK